MYTCRSLYLAFNKDSYSPIYAFLSLSIARLCVPLGCLFLLCVRKVKQYDLVLVTLPLSYWLMQIVHTYGSYQGGGELTFLTSVIFVLLPTRVKKQIFQCVYQIIQLNNIISIILWIDFFLFNCLTNLGLYENSIQKLTELLNNIDQSSNKYISTIYHSLAWCYLLNCQYSECIKYTNLAIENKDPSCDLCYFIPYSYYKQKEYLKCLDYIESHLEYADDFYKPFLQAISARTQKQNVDFEKNIILYYQSLLQNNVYEDIPLIQSFILDYYTETNNKDMMIKILIDIKSFNDKDLTLKSSTLFTTSQS